ncbi:hypothetical protein PFICI_09380 [Pestalotiopsis fici W106-1]|uniref:Carboxylic ester hydrolase n=1 Tax=Pestalotiopsis fici (strain W106-1 / CGMCC3.15140) TaxID=1229662 RepID=W3X2B2_PESFW|nr:uncharacterized protein PFICI_09380 [Pestalotiopsis fici W106-1]ETS79527.1 hypothetical protein PFICI_09380 [Pestalotiopsis fici W106-1]
MHFSSRSRLIPGLLALASTSAAQTVNIANGTIQGGKCNRTDSYYFSSIPYALPPVDDLRFKAPQPHVQAYNGTLDATVAPASCIQFSTLFAESNTQSEDCLYLNIWTPSTATRDSKLPVKVWLYGGGNEAGGVSDPTYDGCYATSDSIIVSINYRVGPLGFLALESLGLNGNFGLQDQLLGLEWIQENIESFGGDPTKVLLFGQSAGAIDVYVISTLPQATELISSVALESGGGRDPPTVNKAQQWQQHFLDQLNCTTPDLDCVLAASTSELVVAEAAMPDEQAPGATTPFTAEGARANWGPLVDGNILPETPTAVGNKVPAIFGFNSEEGTLFVFGDYQEESLSLTQADYDVFLEYNFGPLASVVNQTYSVSKFNSTIAPVFAAMSTVLGEVSYKCPAHRALLKSREIGVPVWSYEFSHTPSCAWYGAIPESILEYVGATHTAEIPFVFNTTHNMPLPDGNCTFTNAEQALSASMSEAWTSMAEFGRPADETVWPQWTRNTSAGVNIDESMVVGTVDYTSCLFWDAIYEKSVEIANAS